MVNLELYRIFYVVAEEGNITKASEILNISQPAVTKHIKNLEAQLNTPLFIRTKKGVVLNECGKKIFLNVKRALSLLDDVDGILEDYQQFHTGTIKIGTSTAFMKSYLLKCIELFHEKYPNIIVNIDTDPTAKLLEKLKSGAIDFVIGKIPQHLDFDLQYHELGKTRYIFAANKNYFPLDSSILNPNDLMKYPILLQEYPSHSRRSAENYFELYHLDVQPKMNIASSRLLTDFVSMGYGIGYLTELYAEKELIEGNLSPLAVSPAPEEVSYGIIYLNQGEMISCCKKFMDVVLSYSTKKT